MGALSWMERVPYSRQKLGYHKILVIVHKAAARLTKLSLCRLGAQTVCMLMSSLFAWIKDTGEQRVVASNQSNIWFWVLAGIVSILISGCQWIESYRGFIPC